jgi:hypothetical protein
MWVTGFIDYSVMLNYCKIGKKYENIIKCNVILILLEYSLFAHMDILMSL